jgi:putative effector of murein hydrolase
MWGSLGGGTATLIQKGDEPHTAAVSSVAMILTGVWHSTLCAIPVVKRTLCMLAGAGAG